MMGKLHNIAILLLIWINASAQFPPPAGQEGTTAIHMDSSLFISWATACTVERGYKDISNPEQGVVNAGEEVFATGKADNQIISLGDGGEALLSFDPPIKNGQGFDFAVFENGFLDDFLELAFVEVSSDGFNFFRFDAVSLTQTNEQIGTFDPMDASVINNLAGKYRVEYGVPFDLDELEDNLFLDKDSIGYVRIIDVVGCLQNVYATFDSQDNKINDPWPTPFDSGGFDLDAIGVLHNTSTAGVNEDFTIQLSIFPNPVNQILFINSSKSIDFNTIDIFDEFGSMIKTSSFNHQRVNSQEIAIDLSSLSSGFYFIRLVSDNNLNTKKFLKL